MPNQLIDSYKEIEVKVKLTELEAGWIKSALSDKRYKWSDNKKMLANLTKLIDKTDKVHKEVFDKACNKNVK